MAESKVQKRGKGAVKRQKNRDCPICEVEMQWAKLYDTGKPKMVLICMDCGLYITREA